MSTSPSVQFVSFYFRNNFQHCRKPTHLPSPFFDHFCPIPIDWCYVLADDSGLVPHFTANSFPTPSFPLTSAYNFISFRFVRVNCPILTRGPPTLNTTNPNFFGFRFRNRIIRFLNPDSSRNQTRFLFSFY